VYKMHTFQHSCPTPISVHGTCIFDASHVLYVVTWCVHWKTRNTRALQWFHWYSDAVSPVVKFTHNNSTYICSCSAMCVYPPVSLGSFPSGLAVQIFPTPTSEKAMLLCSHAAWHLNIRNLYCSIIYSDYSVTEPKTGVSGMRALNGSMSRATVVSGSGICVWKLKTNVIKVLIITLVQTLPVYACSRLCSMQRCEYRCNNC